MSATARTQTSRTGAAISRNGSVLGKFLDLGALARLATRRAAMRPGGICGPGPHPVCRQQLHARPLPTANQLVEYGPYGGIPGIFKQFTVEAGLDYDASLD